MSVDLLEGDMRQVLDRFPDEAFDCVIADCPYGQTALEWDRWVPGWPSAVRRVLKRTGSMWVFGTLRMFMDNADEFGGWRQSQDVVWEKQNGSGFARDRFRRVHEQAVHFYRSDATWGAVYRRVQVTLDAKAKRVNAKAVRVPHAGQIGPHVYETAAGGPRLMRSVIKARNLHRRGVHPTQKPADLVAPLVSYACPPGGLILDPFAGSGVTGAVAKSLGMQAVLIEADPVHAATIRRLGVTA